VKDLRKAMWRDCDGNLHVDTALLLSAPGRLVQRAKCAYYRARARLAAPLSAYGVRGDGFHDDTAALQLAFDSQRYIWWPAGEYLLSGDLLIRPGARIIGDGPRLRTYSDTSTWMRYCHREKAHMSGLVLHGVGVFIGGEGDEAVTTEELERSMHIAQEAMRGWPNA